MRMSPRKQSNTQRNAHRFMLAADYGELPAYNVDEYADRLIAARRKFDRLCRFSSKEHELSVGSDREQIDWDMERKKRGEALDRWLRDTSAVAGELLKLFH